MVQQLKLDEIAKLKEELGKYSSFVFTDYRGMNVAQMSGLRKSLREKGAEFHVVKNRSVKRAMQELGHGGLDGYLVNPTALVYSTADLSEVSRLLMDSAKESSLKLKGGFSEGMVLSAESIAKIAKLPPKQVLIGQAVGLLNAPISSAVFVLSGVISKFLRTLAAIEEKKS